MAPTLHQNTTLILLMTIFFFLSLCTADDYYSTDLNPNKTLGFKQEKLTHIHFYFHDVVSGRNPTAVKVAQAPTTNASAVSFGYVAVIDDPLTVGPEPTSKKIGSAQGIYVSASQSEIGLLMVQNYVFTDGRFNGSTLSILGHNAILNKVRELPIVGGSGVFRFARGYAEARTYVFNTTSLDAIVEYNVYVLHYY
ncbi:Disease resistance response protein [Trema orientale]|uniref:Dirigent protein n=1 Tax=Trema orientale TaxID=63057 RepID=A0A2P5APM3_TREOI|nr:Disease resistance response protein [Trema orientale]